MKLIEFNRRVWPYGFKMWLWAVGLRLRELGVFKSDDCPTFCFGSLDPESWMVHFMNGLRPWDAVDLDIKEGGE